MSGLSWSVAEFERSVLVDARFRRVLAELLEAQFQACGLSFSGACGNALRQASGRLLRHGSTTPGDLLAGHWEETVKRCQGEPVIVVAQDTSSYNFSSHVATQGLGPITHSAQAQGIHQHSALALLPNGLPLGVIDAHFWTRPAASQSAASRRKKPIEEKESYRWLQTSQRVEQRLHSYLEEGGQVVMVADREADIFDLFAQPHHPHFHHLVRAAHPRMVEVLSEVLSPDGPQDTQALPSLRCSLLEATDHGVVLGEYDLTVPARSGEKARQARMQLSSVRVQMLPPQQGQGHSQTPIPVWVVQARELIREPRPLLTETEASPTNADAKASPTNADAKASATNADAKASAPSTLLNWTLITTQEAADFEAARLVVHWYTCRWEIERLHFTLKSGCQAERLQMDDAATLCNTLAVYLIVAWRLLYVTHLGRVDPELPVAHVLDETEQAVLTQQSRTPIITVAQAIVAIAKLGGYEPYKNGPPAGVKVLWMGLRQLEAMTQGWKLAMASMRTKM